VTERALLLAHAVLGFGAVFAGTHHAAHALVSAFGRPQTSALRRFGLIAPAAIVAQAIFGLAIYPEWRMRVRPDLDLRAPMVSQLFELKEHFGALALAIVVAASAAGRFDRPPQARWAIAALSCLGTLLLWTAAIIGLYVTVRHPL
jgi:hypothetical protein